MSQKPPADSQGKIYRRPAHVGRERAEFFQPISAGRILRPLGPHDDILGEMLGADQDESQDRGDPARCC